MRTRDLARGMDANDTALPEPDRGAERARHRGGRGTARLDAAGHADADEAPLLRAASLSFCMILIAGELGRLVEQRVVVTAVVDERHRRLIGKLVLAV